MIITKEQALAYRWEKSGLNRPLPISQWREHLRNPLIDSPPGVAPLAVAARTDGEAPFTQMFDEAWERGEIDYIHAMRLILCYIRPEDFDTITLGAQPPDGDYSMYYPYIKKQCRERGFDMRDIYPAVLDAMLEALRDGPMRIADLADMLNMLLPPQLQNLDDGIYKFSQTITMPAFMSGMFKLLPRIGTQRVLALREDATDRMPSDENRKHLARLYLSNYGPSTYRDFAAWLGWSSGKNSAAALAWELVEDETVELICDGKPLRLLARDLDSFMNAPPPTGLRLLPTRDPYMAQRPQEWLMPDARTRKLIWPVVMPPGTLHWDGRLCGIWKLKKNGPKGEMYIDAFDPLVYSACTEDIEMWAERIAVARGVTLHKLELN